MDFIINAADDGRCVRDFLRTTGVSSALASKLKQRERGILLNGCRVTVRAILKTGDVLSLAIEDDAASEKLLPYAFELDFIQKTGDFLLVNKPPFMPTHPSHGHFDDTLANALVYCLGAEDPTFRPRFINRLDRNTSGVVLVARHALAAARLSGSMAAGDIQKGYLALVKGRFSDRTVLETGIRRRAESIIFREVCPAGEGDLAITVVTPLAVSDTVSLVRLEPRTGRTHQLRVHMASVGHPILGDELYGGEAPLMERHALHAAFLRFPDPASGACVTCLAPLPDDMRTALLQCFGEEGIRLAEGAFSET